ncbi:cyclic peptide transporter, partial [Pseudomonas syringae pv. tagetis]
QDLSARAKDLRNQRKRPHHIIDEKIHCPNPHLTPKNIRAANIFFIAETFGTILIFAVIGMAIEFQALWPTNEKTVLGGFV